MEAAPFPSESGLFDVDSNACRNFLHKANHVPVGHPHATMAERSANRIGLVCPVNADAGFVASAPDDAHRIVGSRWKHVKVACADTMVQYAFVPPKCRHG